VHACSTVSVEGQLDALDLRRRLLTLRHLRAASRCGFGMCRDEAVNLGRSDSARGAYLDPSELARLEEPI